MSRLYRSRFKNWYVENFLFSKIQFFASLYALLFKLNPGVFTNSSNVQLKLKLKVNYSIVPLLFRNYISLSRTRARRKAITTQTGEKIFVNRANFQETRPGGRFNVQIAKKPSRSRLSHEIEGSSFTGHSHSLTPVDVSIKFSPVRVGNLN